jgi:hypothetical protein
MLDEEAIRAKAHQLWLDRGCPPGEADQDWFEAERLLRAEAAELAESEEQPPSSSKARPRASSAPPAEVPMAADGGGESGPRPQRSPSGAPRARTRKR